VLQQIDAYKRARLDVLCPTKDEAPSVMAGLQRTIRWFSNIGLQMTAVHLDYLRIRPAHSMFEAVRQFQPRGDAVTLPNNSHTWWSLNLGDGVSASVVCEQIKDEFRELHADADQADAAAVFISRDQGDLHCQVIAYLSPRCGVLARRLDAEPCAAPSPAGLELLAGMPTCWSVLFSSQALR
jgi:hypothetical protein